MIFTHGGPEINSATLHRRRFLQTAAAVTAAPYLRTSHAAGSLTAAFWDHVIPGANSILSKLCKEWAANEKVELKIEFVEGFNLLMTDVSEGRAKSGHDIVGLPTWAAAAHAGNLSMQYGVRPCLLPLLGVARWHGPSSAYRIPRCGVSRHLSR